jgi:hypothetical protein
MLLPSLSLLASLHELLSAIRKALLPEDTILRIDKDGHIADRFVTQNRSPLQEHLLTDNSTRCQKSGSLRRISTNT